MTDVLLYAEITTGDRQCGFLRNNSTTVFIFCILQMFKKIWNKMEQYLVRQLFTDSRKPTIQLGESYFAT